MAWHAYAPLDGSGTTPPPGPDEPPEPVVTIEVRSTEPGQSRIRVASNADALERRIELLEAAVRELRASTRTLAELL